MVKKYTHYGVEVTRQVISQPFVQALDASGAKYTELPLLSSHVVAYQKGGARKYALVCPQNIPDDYAEAVYTTPEVPADCDWDRLARDVEGQADGEPPMQLPTRLKRFLDAACMGFGPDPDPAEVRLELASLGYDLSQLATADSHDVDGEFLRRLVQA